MAFNDSAETVIDRILGCNLPQHVDSLDRKLRRQEPQQQQQKPPPLPHEYAQTALVPYTGGEPITETTAPPPSSSTSLMLTRRNVFDGDEFDVFSGKVVQQDALIFGKKE